MEFDWKKLLRRTWPLLLALAALLVLDRLFPPPEPEAKRHAIVVLARDGTPLRAFPDRDHLWRHPVSLDEVSPRYLEALIGYEDRWFWRHPGVNPFALLRAVWQRAVHGRIVSGGSTLTMQVARMLEPMPRTIGGKLRQCVRALQLELRHSKPEILRLYVNHAPMGGVIEGVEAASRAYLGKSAQRLTDAEAALLAVLPQAPSALRPDRHPDKARLARDKVLRRMSARWGNAGVRDAMMEPAYAAPIAYPRLAPLLAERMRREGRGQDRIGTTIDAGIQSALEQRLSDRALQLPARVSLAALVIDNASLEVLAYAGSADFDEPARFSHVDMVQAARSPGSALKPFLYAFAIDDGLIHSESLLADVPQSFSGYQPGNFQQSFNGPVSVSEALVRSLNVPAVEVLERLGPARFVSQLRRGGLPLAFARDAEPTLSVVRGGAGVTLEQLTAAYTAFARRGVAAPPRYARSQPLREARMMSEGASFIIRTVLESGASVDRSFHTSHAAQHRIAWKTGTSFGFRDAWAVGVTDRHTVGVWVGRPDGTPNPGHFGANVAAPLLLDVFAALPEAPASIQQPPRSVSREPICWPLGLRRSATPTALCHVQRTAWLLHETAPPTFPDRVRPGEARYAYHVASAGGGRIDSDCTFADSRELDAARWPAMLEPWLDPGLRQRALPPPWDPRCPRRLGTQSAIEIVGTSDRAVLHRVAGAAPLVRLELRGQREAVNWLVNGTLRARTGPGQGYAHRFTEPGRYEITACDDSGAYDRISVSVR
jgi:penicillin-binding protein 1C